MESYPGEAQHLQKEFQDEVNWIRDLIDRLPTESGGNGSTQAFHQPGVTDNGCIAGGLEHEMLLQSLREHQEELELILAKAKAKGIPLLPNSEAGTAPADEDWQGQPVVHPAHGGHVHPPHGSSSQTGWAQSTESGDGVAGSQVIGVVTGAGTGVPTAVDQVAKGASAIAKAAKIALGAFTIAALMTGAFLGGSKVGKVTDGPVKVVDQAQPVTPKDDAVPPKAPTVPGDGHGSRPVDSGQGMLGDREPQTFVVVNRQPADGTCQSSTSYSSNGGGMVMSSGGCGQASKDTDERRSESTTYQTNDRSQSEPQDSNTNTGGQSTQSEPGSGSNGGSGTSGQTYQDTTVGQPTYTYGG